MKQGLNTQISWKFRRDLNSMLKLCDQIFGVTEAGSHLTQKKKKKDYKIYSLEKVKLEAGHLEHLGSGYHNDISCDK